MGEARSSNERKNLVVKTLIIAVLLLIAFLSSVIYIFAYPKTTVTLHDDETAAFKVLSQFKVKKYSKLGELAAHEKNGYTFLYWAYEETEDPRFRQIAQNHADTALEYFIRPDGSVNHIVSFDSSKGDYIERFCCNNSQFSES